MEQIGDYIVWLGEWYDYIAGIVFWMWIGAGIKQSLDDRDWTTILYWLPVGWIVAALWPAVFAYEAYSRWDRHRSIKKKREKPVPDQADVSVRWFDILDKEASKQ